MRKRTISNKEKNETIENLGINNYRILQKNDGFRFGMDAVLLSDFAQAKTGDHVLDLGTGTGIIPILMEAKGKGSSFDGLEIQGDMADMARRSVVLNHLEDKIRIVEGDICAASTIFFHDEYQVIVSNPPYMVGGHGAKNQDEGKRISRHEILCTFEDIAKEAKILLKNKGSLYLVHRSYRLAEIMNKLKVEGLEPKRLRMVHPYAHKPSNIFLLEAVKDGRPRMDVEPPLIVYEKENEYTKEIKQIYGIEGGEM